MAGIIVIITMSINKKATDVDMQAVLRLWQLISPSLPVGGYAYSQGLETVIDSSWVNNENETSDWLRGVISHNMQYLDLPVLNRLYCARELGNRKEFEYWNTFLLASRETSEIKKEDAQLAAALNRLARDLDLEIESDSWFEAQPEVSFAASLASIAVSWAIPRQTLCYAYVWIWLENQVAAAIKLIPLGQTAGQRILLNMSDVIINTVEKAETINDEQIGMSCFALAIASAKHETQYTRLFRS